MPVKTKAKNNFNVHFAGAMRPRGPESAAERAEERFSLSAIPSSHNLPYSLHSTSPSFVAAELVHALQLNMASSGQSFLGTCCFINDVPAMLDSSKALTATVACCLDACRKDQVLPPSQRTLDPKLYGRALKAINEALAHEEARNCVGTFLAVVLIGRLESLLAPRQLARIPCWSVHAAGISELLKYRGVFDPNNRTIYHALLENFGPIMAHSVFQGEDCFLSAREWQAAFRKRQSDSDFDRILVQVFAQLAFLPSLIKTFRQFRQSTEGAFEKTLDLALTMYDTLSDIGDVLQREIISRLDIGPPTWMDINAPIRLVYLNPGHDRSRMISWHAVLTLIANKTLISLSQMAPTEHSPIWYSTQDLREQNRVISQRVWMLSEEARRMGLMQFYFYPGAISSTIDCASSQSERDWIVDLLNEVMGSTWQRATWTEEAVNSVNLTLTGMLD